MSDAPRPRGRPRKHPLPEARAAAARAMEGFARVMPAGAQIPAFELLKPAADPAEPVCTGRVRWKGSSGAHPRGALQVAWQCAGGIEWRPLEVVGPDAPDTEDA